MKQLIIAMHLLLTCSVFVGDLEASPFIDEIEVRSGWKELIDEAEITIPKKLMEFGLIDVQPGQEVSINVGYEIPGIDQSTFYTRDVFKGYVSQVNPKVPLQIRCEDAGWLFKQTNINKSWTSPVTFKEIITYITSEVNTANPVRRNVAFNLNDLPDITFESFRIPNKNAAQVLQTFKENPYNLAIYFRDHDLNIHMAYDKSYGNVEYFLDQNVIDHDLEYRNPGDQKIQVKAVVLKPDNTFTEEAYGEPGGDTVTLTFNKGENPELVKQLTDLKLKRYAEGYRGRIQTFMIPFANHSMTARLVDPEFIRDDSYHIDSTTLKFGDGITIDVELGIKVS
jgi:hypothetical protein